MFVDKMGSDLLIFRYHFFWLPGAKVHPPFTLLVSHKPLFLPAWNPRPHLFFLIAHTGIIVNFALLEKLLFSHQFFSEDQMSPIDDIVSVSFLFIFDVLQANEFTSFESELSPVNT